MSEIAKIVGQRIRSYRTTLGYSQEKLAELAGCHPSYIGQLERGEKNASLESIARIASALDISLSELFEKIDGKAIATDSIPLICYEMLLSKSEAEQRLIHQILIGIERYKNY